MVTRPATASDLSKVYDMMLEMHARSKYAQDADVDQQTARALLMQALQRHGGKNNGSTYFVVDESDGNLNGFMIGTLQRLYLIGNRLEAMDLYLYARADAPPRSAHALLKSYVDWASDCPKVASIKLSWTDALGVDGERLGALYERKGFKPHGGIYEKVMAA